MQKKQNIIRGFSSLQQARQPSVVSIGNFDGVHLGHCAVINTLLLNSKRLGLPATIITFDPLAREFFSPEKAIRICSLEERIHLLFELGVDQIIVIEFNEEFSEFTEQKFINDILLGALGVKYLNVGDDFRFGKDRRGDFSLLQKEGEKHGFHVSAHDTFEFDGSRVSSQRIRNRLSEGDFETVEHLLGRPYSISGKVSKGQQLGRKIGYPTANIKLDSEDHSTKIKYVVNGVFAVNILFSGQRNYDKGEQGLEQRVAQGMANVGSRPTVGGSENRLEVNIFDFDQDCYGEEITVVFRQKIREEQKFSSVEELTKQIALDEQQVKQFFSRTEHCDN